MPNDKFKYEKATVTIRAKRGSDELDSPWILHDLLQLMTGKSEINVDDISDREWTRLEWFTNILLCSKVKGNLGFPWPDYQTATTEEILAAYEQLMSGDPVLVRTWQHAFRRANLEVVNPED